MKNPQRWRELAHTKKLRCEAVMLTLPTLEAALRPGMRAQCTTNGEPHPCGHVLCWTHRTRYDAGKPIEFVPSAATLALLFPNPAVGL